MSTTPPRAMNAHNNLHALLFQATSAEYIALCLQAYQLARHAFRDRLNSGTFRNPAVVYDLDETVLDNHAYQAWQIKTGTNYDATSWNRWCNAVQAEAVPGAIEFIQYVEQAGATPIFITSRDKSTREATLKNLNLLGALNDKDLESELNWAHAGDTTILAQNTRLFMAGMDKVTTAGPSGGKEWILKNKFDQRSWVVGARGFEIILSVGDNLGDYAEYYGKVYDKSIWTFYDKLSDRPIDGRHPKLQERRSSVLQDASLFGRDFVLIPNSTYGGWLRAFEANQLGSSDELAGTSVPVRDALNEPQTPFTYANPKAGQPNEPEEITKTPAGPKFDAKNQLRIWDGQ